MSEPKPKKLIEPLREYEGPWEAYAIDPNEPYRRRSGQTDHFIQTSIVVGDHLYYDAIKVYVDRIDRNEPFYLDLENARKLHEMLGRDIAKLDLIIQLDPED